MSSQHAGSRAFGPGQCQTCGSHVTDAYRRVRGGNDDRVYACPSCPTEHEHTEHEIAGLQEIGGGES